MGIKFRCQACGKKLHVKAFLAGKRGVCPRCGAKVWIPLPNGDEATAAADPVGQEVVSHAVAEGSSRRATPVAPPSRGMAANGVTPPNARGTGLGGRAAAQDPLAEAAGAVWYVRPPSGGQFGPADATIMRRWLAEGRIGSDALVWREGWAEWNRAQAVFASLDAPLAVIPEPVTAAPAAARQDAGVVSELRRTTTRRSLAPAPRRPTRRVAVVLALGVLCAALGVVLFFVLHHAS